MEKFNVTNTDYEKPEAGNEAVDMTIKELTPEKQASLAYFINLEDESLMTLTNTLGWYEKENDTATIELIHGLIAAYGEASTQDEEKQIIKQIVSKL